MGFGRNGQSLQKPGPSFLLFSMVTGIVLKVSFTKTRLRQLKALATNNTVPKAELCLWEEQWLYCASQRDLLVDFWKLFENYEILLDSLWKQPDWAYLKDHVIPKAQVE